MDLLPFKIINLTASVMAKCLYKIPQREKVQNAKLRMVWNIPLTIFYPSHQPADFMAFDDDCIHKKRKVFLNTYSKVQTICNKTVQVSRQHTI